LRSLQEIQLDFEEEAKAYAGLWSQGKKKEECAGSYMLQKIIIYFPLMNLVGQLCDGGNSMSEYSKFLTSFVSWCCSFPLI
jgi:hypothetical protein